MSGLLPLRLRGGNACPAVNAGRFGRHFGGIFGKLKVVAVGHGGRDVWLSLALVEAVAFDEVLRDSVDLEILSCTWPNDAWEPSMDQYLTQLQAKLRVGDLSSFVRFHVFQYVRITSSTTRLCVESSPF